jgi:Caenorhabditis protein of unknown function, DUF268
MYGLYTSSAVGSAVLPGFALEPLAERWNVSDCLDINELLAFKQSYYIGPALMNMTDFSIVMKAGVQRIHYSCVEVFKTKEETATKWPPPSLQELEQTEKEYLLNLALRQSDAVKITNYYVKEEDDKQNQGKGYQWPQEDIVARAGRASSCGEYRKSHCEKMAVSYEKHIKGRHGMVIGSQSPWAEALLFRFGAARVTTIEYMPITTTHPDLITLTPAQAAAQFLSKTLEHPDFVFSFSSLEHDGLGRYGDPLNAFGDLETIAKVHCILKEHGLFFLGLPVGYDAVQYNAHRIYGYHRLSIILSMGFRLIDAIYDKPFKINDPKNDWTVQPALVLQKVVGAGHHHSSPHGGTHGGVGVSNSSPEGV